jgi:ubiquinone/menaquinone biosynthesis C-methylase UbiE
MDNFETTYLKVREKEGFLFQDEQVKKLPHVAIDDPNFDKWQMRQKSTTRLLVYLVNVSSKQRSILDLGCGNGWFTAKMASVLSCQIEGWDVNALEIRQAQRVFQKSNLVFKVEDVFVQPPNQKFGFIILNSVLQYFQDIPRLISTLKHLLQPTGEIHILDTPIYKKSDVEQAKNRSLSYYQQLGYPEMAHLYFHHSFEDLENYTFTPMYNPHTIPRRILRKLGVVDSPFIWLKLKASNII